MFRDRRWFVIPSSLTYESERDAKIGLIKLIRYYEMKYDRMKGQDEDDYKVLNSKDTEDVNELLYRCVDFNFESYDTDVIKERLWRLLDL